MVGFMCVSMICRARRSGQPALEDLPAHVPGDPAVIAVALADEEIGAVGDRDQRLGPFGIAGIGEQRLAVGKPQRGRRRAGLMDHLGGPDLVPEKLGVAAELRSP